MSEKPKPWINHENGDWLHDFECPDCKYTVLADDGEIADYNYCPICGKRRTAEDD